MYEPDHRNQLVIAISVMPSAINIREPVYDATAEDGGADVARILGQLTSPLLQGAPKETPQSIGQRLGLPNTVTRIDDEHQTVACFVVVEGKGDDAVVEEERHRHVVVLWWLPRIPWAEDNMPDLIPVFGAACEEVMRRWPGSEDWAIYGDYPGVGETWDDRDASSREMVDDWVAFWNSSPTVGVFARHGINPYNQSQHRPVGTVGKVVEFAAWLEAQRNG